MEPPPGGGLVDVEFLGQFLLLLNAHESPDIVRGATVTCFEALAAGEAISVDEMRALVSADRMQRTGKAMLRLTSGGDMSMHEAPGTPKPRLVRALEYESFDALEAGLRGAQERVFSILRAESV